VTAYLNKAAVLRSRCPARSATCRSRDFKGPERWTIEWRCRGPSPDGTQNVELRLEAFNVTIVSTTTFGDEPEPRHVRPHHEIAARTTPRILQFGLKYGFLHAYLALAGVLGRTMSRPVGTVGIFGGIGMRPGSESSVPFSSLMARARVAHQSFSTEYDGSEDVQLKDGVEGRVDQSARRFYVDTTTRAADGDLEQ